MRLYTALGCADTYVRINLLAFSILKSLINSMLDCLLTCLLACLLLVFCIHYYIHDKCLRSSIFFRYSIDNSVIIYIMMYERLRLYMFVRIFSRFNAKQFKICWSHSIKCFMFANCAKRQYGFARMTLTLTQREIEVESNGKRGFKP